MRGTQSVGVTLLFWFGGAATAIAGTFVFIELGLNIPRYVIDGSKEAIPKNGGELNYVRKSLILMTNANSIAKISVKKTKIFRRMHFWRSIYCLRKRSRKRYIFWRVGARSGRYQRLP